MIKNIYYSHCLDLNQLEPTYLLKLKQNQPLLINQDTDLKQMCCPPFISHMATCTDTQDYHHHFDAMIIFQCHLFHCCNSQHLFELA